MGNEILTLIDWDWVWETTAESLAFSVAFSPDGKLIVSGSIDNTIKIWDSADPKKVQEYENINVWN